MIDPARSKIQGCVGKMFTVRNTHYNSTLGPLAFVIGLGMV